MESGSPYGIRDGDLDDASVTTVVDCDTGIIDLAVRGRWRHQLWQQAHQAVATCLAGHAGGIVIDLHHLDDPRAGSVPLWLTTRAQGAALHPPVPVLATVPATTALAARLNRPGARRHLPVAATVADAHATLAEHDPFTDQLRLPLPPEPAATVAARDAVAGACRQWRLTPLIHTARLVISELVANATEHAGTPIDVIMSRLGTTNRDLGLHLAVYDRDPRLPQRPSTGSTEPLEHRHLGLRVVDAAAHAWGAMPARNGKMVWATLRPPPHPH
ncbi:ATP-binding protein [Actinoplanes sp. NPDC051475]|uniref:ATP-binding protein n=1 Tax=Actinoplanes sp. NPDC051475 TaxID=3157225 RepID=UPI00344EC5A5